MEKKFIGFDLGAESGRCIVANLSDKKITLNEVHRFTSHCIKYENGFYWDILAIYEEIIEGLTKARKSFGKYYDGIGIDTWGVDYVLIDSENRILGYPHHYRDDRTDDVMLEAFQIVPQEEIYNKTGIQSAQFNTLFQLMSEGKQNLNLLNFSDKVLLIPDFINFLLSGKKQAEYSIASTTGLADPIKRDWSWELIDSFGFPRKIFPEIVEPGTTLGMISPFIAERTGLDKNIPIIASACHDTASAVVSVPAREGNWAFLSSGTWSLMGVELKEPLISSEALKYNFTNEGGVACTTRFLKNIIGLWPIQECRRFWLERSKEYSYQELVSSAKENGFAKSWVDLSDPRFLKAGEMPEKIITYLKETGQAIKYDIGFIIRVVLESLAFSYRNTIKEIESISGNKINILHAVGGGIQNELLTQLTSDAIGRNVLAGPVEGTIIGNIGVQAIASGSVHDLQEWRLIVANSFELKMYEPKEPRYFDENERNYNNILKEINCYHADTK